MNEKKKIDNFISDLVIIFSNKLPKYLEQLLEGFQVTKSIEISFDIDHSREINAYASGKHFTYNISLNKGIIYALYNSIYELLNQSGTAKILGITEEFGSKKFIEYRAKYSALIIDSTIRYILLHEFAHIVMGHLDWLNSEYNLNKLVEFGPNNGLDKISFHSLEAHADAIALGPLAIINSIDTYYVGIAITLLHNILAKSVDKFQIYNSIKHPHPYIRWAVLYRLINVNMNKKIISQSAGNRLLKGVDDTMSVLKFANLDNLQKPIIEFVGAVEAAEMISNELRNIHQRLIQIDKQLMRHSGFFNNV